ncbi:vitamin K epoxide reductase family protein [Pseudomonas corrugata]|uniref:vitamin K epoxide reductase family protein n=1 Tax=Pseudomonas corrugata TaxID=47879 RepID=UPI000464CA68|nr:vitamin K epoxide reductase family protein [Pseudomonas corrugata]
MENQGEYERQGAMHSDQSMDEHMQLMEHRHLATMWCHFLNALLGFWLISAPFVFGYLTIAPDDLDLARLSAERELPDVATRAWMMTWNDVVSGSLIVLFALLSLKRVGWANWANTLMGLWLMSAPLLFWTPSAASYGNAILIGGLVITFSVLVPMMPGMSMGGMMQKGAVPPGWDYNPSTWLQRLPIAALALIGVLLARYLAAYQLGHTANAWDPFFPAPFKSPTVNGTEAIITSDMSRLWPVSDAGVGVLAYMIELTMAVMGDGRRWRTMPWMVAAFGIVVVPLGSVSIFFIIAQPIIIGTWCTLCLIQALAMLLMMPYALDELVAMGQFLKDAKRRGKPMWKTFFKGDAMQGCQQDDTPEFTGSLSGMALKALRGVNVPWSLLLLCVLGVWLMFTRLIFGTTSAMANSDHLMGSLLLTVTVLALAEVARPLRLLNLPIGVWLLAAPWLLEGGSTASTAGSLIAGVLVIVLSLPRGPIRHRYGGWNRLIR